MKKVIFITIMTMTMVVNIIGFIPSAQAAINSLSIYSGNNQTVNVNSNTLEGLVVIARDVGGNPVLGVGVNFAVILTPSGATGHSVTPGFATTTAQGLAATVFRAGNLPGTYLVLAQAGALSVTFTLTAVAGLQPATVVVTPSITNAQAQYRATFNVSSAGALSVGGRISITFPTGTTVPTSIPAAQIRVNSVALTTAPTISVRTVNILTPVAVSNNGTVEVILLEGAGIINPATATNYRLSVSTSADITAVESNLYSLIAGLSPALVAVTPNSVSSVAQYKINFTVSPTGALNVGSRITVEFPFGTTVPVIIGVTQIRVNNVILTTSPSISSRTVNIFTPVAIANNGAVEVLFLEGAGITNPATIGDYRIKVSTLADTSLVDSSAYNITVIITPTTIITTSPASPDGLAGWFKTSPTITLTSTSPGGAVTIFYRWGTSGLFSTYTAPFRPAEGINTLHYYGRDVSLNVETIKTREFKIDTIAPVIQISNFPVGGFVNTPSIVLEGTVEVGATLSLNTIPVTVAPNGTFVTVLSLSTTGPTVLSWLAMDLAGNNSVLTQTITLDTIPPFLEIISPLAGTTVRNHQVELKGRTETDAVVKVNNKDITVAADGIFQTILTLEPGNNNITVVSTDKAKNTTTRTISITYQPTLIIVTQVGNRTAQINDKSVVLDVAPVIKDGRTLVPFRFIAESFGAEVIWDGVFKIIIVNFEGNRIILQVDKNIASVNGVSYQLDVAPTIIGNRTMVPIRFIAEQLNSSVAYNDKTKTITIINPKP